MDKEIVWGVRIETGDLSSQAKSIQSQIDQLKSEQAGLNTTTAEGSKAYKENAASLRLLESQQKLVTKQLGALTEEEKKNTDQTNFNNNSIKQNRELLKELNAEYIKIAKPTADQTKRVRELSDTLKAQESAIGNNTRQVGNYKEAFGQALNGVNIFGKGLGDMFKLIAANPIGAFLVVLTGLFSVLKGFEPVFDFFERGLATIKGAFDALVSGGNIAEAAKQSYALAQAVQDLEDAERDYSVEAAKAEAAVKNLIIQAKDRTKTEQERIDLLNQAGRIEENNFQRSLELAKEAFRIEKSRLLQAEQAGRANDELRDKAAQAEIRLTQLASSSADVQERISVRRNALTQAGIEQRQKDADDATKKREKNKAEADKELAETVKRAEEAKKVFADTTAAEFEFTKQATDIFYEQQQAKLKQDFANKLITEQQYNEQALALQIEQSQAQTMVMEDYAGTIKGLDDDIARNKIATQNLATDAKIKNNAKEVEDSKKAAEEQKKIEQRKTDAIKGYINSISSSFAESLAQGKITAKDFAKQVANSVLDILQQQAIASATIQSLTQPDSIATFGVSGIARAAIILIAIKTAFALAKSTINSFAAGGYTGSGFGSPDSSGFKPAGIVHEHEYVTPKRVMQMPSAAPHIRALEGLRVKGYAEGGFVSDRLTIDTGILDAIRQIRPVVSVAEITEVQDRIEYIESQTNL